MTARVEGGALEQQELAAPEADDFSEGLAPMRSPQPPWDVSSRLPPTLSCRDFAAAARELVLEKARAWHDAHPVKDERVAHLPPQWLTQLEKPRWNALVLEGGPIEALWRSVGQRLQQLAWDAGCSLSFAAYQYEGATPAEKRGCLYRSIEDELLTSMTFSAPLIYELRPLAQAMSRELVQQLEAGGCRIAVGAHFWLNHGRGDPQAADWVSAGAVLIAQRWDGSAQLLFVSHPHGGQTSDSERRFWSACVGAVQEDSVVSWL